jgi:hypothetical protein
MSIDNFRNNPTDVPFKAAGTGHLSLFRCMGCDKSRSTAGRRGVGVRMRCAECVAARRKEN